MTKITPITNLQSANYNRVRSTTFQNKSFQLTGKNAVRVNKMTQTLDSYIKTVKEGAKNAIQKNKLNLNPIAILAGIAANVRLSKQDSQKDEFMLSKNEEKDEFILSHREVSYPWWQKDGIYTEKQYTISNNEIKTSGFDITDEYIESVINKANKAFFEEKSEEEAQLENSITKYMHPQLRKGFKGEISDFIKAFQDNTKQPKVFSEYSLHPLKNVCEDKDVRYVLQLTKEDAQVLVLNKADTKCFCAYNIVKKGPNFIQSTSFEQMQPEYKRCTFDNFGQITEISNLTLEDELE